MKLLDHMVILFYVFWGATILFSIAAAPVFIPIKNSNFFTSLSILVIFCVCVCVCLNLFFDWSHPNGCEVAPPCGLLAMFNDNKQISMEWKFYAIMLQYICSWTLKDLECEAKQFGIYFKGKRYIMHGITAWDWIKERLKTYC